MNAQAEILSVINCYGVVIPVPGIRKADSPNFVALMDPSNLWHGNSPVCENQKGKSVFSNVTKVIHIIIWTCMHPWNQLDKPEGKCSLPFRFYTDEEELKKFFGTTRRQKTSGQYWVRIEEMEKANAEVTLCPKFQVLGSKRSYSLL
jgi:hypothetical protein